jgi:hypothetical protein
MNSITGQRKRLAQRKARRNDNRLTGLGYTSDGGQSTIDTYSWAYNAGSLVTSFTTNEGTASYGYDPTNQLTSASYTGTNQPANESYSFTKNGNRDMSGYSTGSDNLTSSDGTYNYSYLWPMQPPATIFFGRLAGLHGEPTSLPKKGSRAGRKIVGGERRGRETTRSQPHLSGRGAHLDRGGVPASVSASSAAQGQARSEPGPPRVFARPGGGIAHDLVSSARRPRCASAAGFLCRGTTRSFASDATCSPAPLCWTIRRSPAESSRGSGKPS